MPTDDSSPAQAAGAAPARPFAPPGTASVFPGEYRFDAPHSQVLQPGPYAIRPVEHTYIASPIDGVAIEMGIYRPHIPDKAPVPVIVQASPYYGNVEGTVVDPIGFVRFLIDQFVPHGYAVVALSVRGTGDSGGCNDLMGPMEIADLDHALTWLGEEPWSNGKIGMTGLSYDGSTPWSAASTGNPHVATIVPISGVPDIYGLMYRNGSSEQRGPFALNAAYFALGVGSAPHRSPAHRVQAALCPEAYEGLVAAAYSGVTGAHDPLGFWEVRNRKPAVAANYGGSVLSVQGLQDWNVDPSQVIPWADELERSGTITKQLLGQWGHTYPDQDVPLTGIDEEGQAPTDRGDDVRWDFAEILLHWFDYWLKGHLDVDLGPPVQVQDSTGAWRDEVHYPPHDSMWQRFHLGAGETLWHEAGRRGTVPLQPVLVPMPSDSAKDASVYRQAADFRTERLDHDLRIAGLPKVHVTVTPHGPGGYIAAFLYSEAGAGDEQLLGWTTMNLAFADGTDQPQDVQPGQPLDVRMEIQPMDGVVRAGDSLLLRVWVYTDGDRLPSIPPGPVDLEYGGDIHSVLDLPTLERTPDVFFEPPRP